MSVFSEVSGFRKHGFMEGRGELSLTLLASTCEWIQETYGISNPTLIANNPQIDANCENIYVGEVLCVDTDDYVYPEVNQTIYQVSLSSGMDARPTAINHCFSVRLWSPRDQELTLSF